MEAWFIFALLSAVFAGLYSFSSKISAHFQHHSAQVTAYSFISATVLAGIYAIVMNTDTSHILLIAFIGLIDAIAYVVVSMTRIDALKEIEATIFFPVYKVISAILAVPIGVFIFSDILSGKEVLGIVIGLLAPLLLITRAEGRRQRNLRKGLWLLFGTVVAALIVTSMSKTIAVLELDAPTYVFFAFALGIPYALYLYKKTNGRAHKTRHVEWVGLLAGVFMFGNLFFFVKALTGNLGTVFLINSFSTVLVVALSVLMFKEHLNFKKAGALIVTVISLILLK